MLVLGVLGALGWRLKIGSDARTAEQVRGRELSYLVDHAVRTPPHCKYAPASKKTFGADLDGLLARGNEPKIKQSAMPKKGTGDKINRTPRDYALIDTYVVKQPIPHAALRGQGGDRIDQILAIFANADIEPTDPDSFICKREVEDLTNFIKEHSHDLNDFVKNNQNDPRVDAVQLELYLQGIEYQKTCKNLRDENSDDYELHQHGCK